DGSSTALLPVTVQSNALLGYTLSATDTSDVTGLACSIGGCAGSGIVDWTGTGPSPTVWNESGSNYGLGVTVLSSAHAPKNSAVWGSGTTARDFANNRYAGLKATAATTLHAPRRYIADTPDVTVLGLRARVSPTQRAGPYAGIITFTVVANP
ncbi:MAG: hypothetical protein ABI200_03310, partial [Gaiellales bacterium]